MGGAYFLEDGIEMSAPEVSTGETLVNEPNNNFVESVAANLRAQIENRTCIDIQKLYKEFTTATGTKVAVDQLNLTLYSGQITALLG
jgi:ABC-type proline/glycine betaine transport system ATPase subunit